MGLVTEHERIDMGRKMVDWKATVTANLNHIDLLLGKLVQAKVDFPSDITELDGYIAQLKTAMQNIVNNY